MSEETMESFVYKSRKKQELYLFVRKEGDFSRVPAPLLQSFGPPEFVMRLELAPERRLARSDVEEVIQKLTSDGFYLQMPPPDPLTGGK
jgi:uncharacterized protein YcgL (UPF0745 family)